MNYVIRKVFGIAALVFVLISSGPVAAQAVMPDINFLRLCAKGTAEEVHQALKSGANIAVKDVQDTTTLMYAAKSNADSEVMTVLLNAVAEFNKKGFGGKNEKGLWEKGIELWNEGKSKLGFKTVDVNDRNKEGKTALMFAVESDVPEVVQVLLDAGADANVKDKQGVTALMLAVKNSLPDVVQILLEDADANTSIKDQQGMTALMYAARSNTTPEIVKKLLGAGADINARDEKGRTALIYAVWKNSNPEIVKVLLDSKADVRAVDKSGHDARWYAESKRKDGKDILEKRSGDIFGGIRSCWW